MRKQGWIVALALVALSLVLVAGTPCLAENIYDKVEKTGVVNVGLMYNSIPAAYFNEKNEPERITGEKDIHFTKDDLSGYSDRVNWLFKEEVIVLMGSPYIVKQSIAGEGGRTEGKELKIDLKTNKITILSSGSRRTETIIK